MELCQIAKSNVDKLRAMQGRYPFGSIEWLAFQPGLVEAEKEYKQLFAQLMAMEGL